MSIEREETGLDSGGRTSAGLLLADKAFERHPRILQSIDVLIAIRGYYSVRAVSRIHQTSEIRISHLRRGDKKSHLSYHLGQNNVCSIENVITKRHNDVSAIAIVYGKTEKQIREKAAKEL